MPHPILRYACLALAAATAVGCKSNQDRADDLGARGNQAIAAHDYRAAAGLFDDAIKLAPLEYAYLGRAQALAQLGDQGGGGDEKAAASLADCHADACSEERRRLAKSALARMDNMPLTDDAGLQKFLRVYALTGEARSCALIAAIARTENPDDQRRKRLAAAVQLEIDDLTKRLGGAAAGEPALKMARELGASAADAKSCDETQSLEMKMLGTLQTVGQEVNSDRADVAFDLGLLSAKRAALVHSPEEAARLAGKPLRSAGDLTAYVEGLTKAGYERPCAVFMAVLRAERLPAPQRAAIKGALRAAIASVAPAGEKAKPAGPPDKQVARVLGSAADVSSGAQTCDELDRIYAQIAGAMANVAAAADDQEKPGPSVAANIDRADFVYRAIRTRFERPMTEREIRQRAEARDR